MPMQLADFPPWLRALFAVFLILFFFNALYAMAFFMAIWTWRIDPGVATLIGVIVGLGIVAWQARLGFTKLIQSQEHRAALEREARQHQQTSDIEREDRRTDEERRFLMAALRAEIAGLMEQAQRALEHSIIIRQQAAKEQNSTQSFKLPTFSAPVYQSNISKLGLLGVSLGTDVVRIMAKNGITVPPAELNQPLSNETVAKLCDGVADGMREWKADLDHVAMRIRAYEEGTPDPGTLREAQNKRQQQEKEKKEKGASPGPRRTTPPKRP
jgi:hypothetical protein